MKTFAVSLVLVAAALSASGLALADEAPPTCVVNSLACYCVQSPSGGGDKQCQNSDGLWCWVTVGLTPDNMAGAMCTAS